MPELIDKQKVYTEIALIAKHLARSDAQKAIIGRILFMIDQMPTIKQEVRHGRWIFFREYGTYHCSECNKVEKARADFCRKCGAKMDGGDAE